MTPPFYKLPDSELTTPCSSSPEIDNSTTPSSTPSSLPSSPPWRSPLTHDIAPSSPPSTHDVSRLGWHMSELSCLAKNVETAVRSAFPNRGRSRYRHINVCLIRWEQDLLGVSHEVDRLGDLFEKLYGFNVKTWLIPSDSTSHFDLMTKACGFLKEFDSNDNLFIIYYAGHGYINQDRQSTWSCSRERDSAEIDWSHIQSLFEKSKSDVLVLLDCCAAASSAPTRRGQGIMETIAACGFESRAPPPGEHSFTNSLIEVLEDWINAPSFSVTMLHSEVLHVLKQRRKEKCTNGRKMEWRSTPVHISNTTNPKATSIELCKRSPIVVENASSDISTSGKDLSQPIQYTTLTTYHNHMSISGDSVREESMQSEQENQPKPNGLGVMASESTHELKGPHMLFSVALEEDQQLPDSEAFSRWICAFPALAKHVTVHGVYKSFSTVLILSIPAVIWNMMPDDPACQPISYVTSKNLLDFPKELLLDRSAEQNSASTRGSSDSPKGLASSMAKKARDEEHSAEPVAIPKFILDDEAIVRRFQQIDRDIGEHAEPIKRWASFKEEHAGGSKGPQKRSQSIRRLLKETFSRAYNRSASSGPVPPPPLPPAKLAVESSNHSGSDLSTLVELENIEVYELPALEPVGSELSTLIDDEATSIPGCWPLPLSPLPLLFAMSELRDIRGGHNNPPKHDTFYHP